MSIQKILNTRVLALFASLLLAACVSNNKHMQLYAGPERPGDEIATLRIAESLEVSSINDEHIPSIPRIVRSGERRFDLLPGRYDAVVYYDVVWPLNSSDDEVVRSESLRVSLELEAGHTYRVEHRLPVDIEDARQLVRDLKLIVVDLSGSQPVRVAAQSRPAVVSTPLVVNPVLEVSPIRSAEDELREESSVGGGARIVAASSGGNTGGISVSPLGGDTMAGGTGARRDARSVPIAMDVLGAEVAQGPLATVLLKFWWQRASPEERAQFRGWIEE